MNLFKNKRKAVPQTYQPVLESGEIIDLFSRMTLHQQAALMRLMSRNVVLDAGDYIMGYELEWSVEGAVIVGRLSADETVTATTPATPQSLPAEQQ
jgi:hypothetical protein